MPVQMQVRRGTATGWTSANPVLLSGEVGYETDTNRLKIGDGVTAWNALPYAMPGPQGPAVQSVALAEPNAADDGFAQLVGPPSVVRPRTFWLNAEGATLDSATFASLGTSANQVRAVAYADAATQGAFWSFQLPVDWVAGPILATPYWVPGSTDGTAHTVRWSFTAKQVLAGADVTAAGTTTAWTGASAARTANLLVIDTPTSLGITPSTPSSLVQLEVQRIGADGADTYVGVVNLVGLLLTYAGND